VLGVLFVAVGGAIGSVTRYLVGGWIAARFGSGFPYGTFAINVTASFIIGLFLAFSQERAGLNPNWRLLVAVGFVGGYSTFSTFEYEGIRMLQDREMLLGAVYLMGSVVAGGVAAVVGIAVGNWI
jgi:fluoride exporter